MADQTQDCLENFTNIGIAVVSYGFNGYDLDFTCSIFITSHTWLPGPQFMHSEDAGHGAHSMSHRIAQDYT